MQEERKKSADIRESLPAELRPIFDQLVRDYRFASTVKHGTPFVSYAVLAELVKMGWRYVGDVKPPKQEADPGQKET